MGVDLRMFMAFVGCFIAATQAAGQQSHPPAASQREIHVHVVFNRSSDVMAWDVHWQALGLDSSQGELELRLADWGEWTRADSLFLRNLRSSVPLEKVDGQYSTLRVVPPAGWDGVLDVTYRILMSDRSSRARETFGLMPWYHENYGQGFTSNTLMDLFVSGEPLVARRVVEFVGDASDTIVSGWGEMSQSRHTVVLDHPLDNTCILFGPITSSARGQVDGVTVEVVQYGAGKALSDSWKSTVIDLVQSYMRSTGRAINGVIRVILTDTAGGGVKVEGALIVGYQADGSDAVPLLLTTAHELFHQWLGGELVRVKQPDAVWFQEGYTDYLALWHLAHLNYISPQQMIDRLVEFSRNIQANPVRGVISFGDPLVPWRDNGPNEQMAYQGGALLAFHTDVELRRRCKPGLSQIVADLAQIPQPVDNGNIKDWYYQHELADFHREFVQQPNFPQLAAAFSAIGVEATRQDAQVAYIGIAIDQPGDFGVITKVDPAGPAHGAGVHVGDRLTGFWPGARRDLILDDGKPLECPYGLLTIPLNKTIHLGIVRNGQEITLDIDPQPLTGVAHAEGFRVTDTAQFRLFLERSQ